MNILVMQLDHQLTNKQFNNLLNHLTISRKNKINKIRKIEDKNKSAFAELILKYALKEYYSKPYKNLTFSFSKYGKPTLENYPDIHFNLSHSHKAILCAIAKYPVGADIEYIRKIDLETSNIFLNKNEIDLFHPLTNDLFFKLWTAKESYLKYEGRGFSLNPKSITLNQSHQGFIVQNKVSKVFINTIDYLEYYISIASTQKHQKLPIKILTQEFIYEYFNINAAK